MSNHPIFTFQHGGQYITVMGTAHISRASADKVRELLSSGEYDAVAVELCTGRHEKITNPNMFADLDLFTAIKKGQGPMIWANLVIGAFQQRLAEQVDIEPGAELKAALEEADRAGYPVSLIDRDISITMRRVYRNIPFKRRVELVGQFIKGFLTRESISEEDVESLKDGDILNSAFAQFAKKDSKLYKPLIDERDQYMALRLIQEANRTVHHHIIAVVGAGHFNGISSYMSQYCDLSESELDAALQELKVIPEKKNIGRYFPWLISFLVLLGFASGFAKNSSLGWELVLYWVVINGGLTSIGALMAKAHPLTILGAFVAAPITSLNPMIGAGVVTSALEIWLRKPRMKDFDSLRHDTVHLAGWWKNRISRTMLVFIFSSLASAIGTYIAGFIIFDRLT
ncbi:pheromone shutdown-related protein TraB [Mariprofundus aestuarium]|uniref:Pheromone shutdown-related protein TraB n=1 Tax=Mariprofundus aestuarium TaxID=1921086 RepID=A0A2K8KWJ0_MARES|nr:TraB/GumN family protein [Mariprofundus aestuarium]ATX79173.1 pheromone shutdown-related protein TraB [Mariprofundus aestuarium]